MSTYNRFPLPQGGAALPLTFHPSPTSTTLIIGTDKLAASRAYTFLDAGARVVIAGSEKQRREACEEVEWRVGRGEVGWLSIPLELDERSRTEGVTDAELIDRWISFLSSISNLLLCTITDTLHIPTSPIPPRSHASATLISLACAHLHIPLNVTDTPSLCTYTFPSTHRFVSSSFPSSSPSTSSASARSRPTHAPLSNLQISISTNGQGCRLASRIKREIVGKLSRDVGGAVDNVGVLRERVRRMSVSKGDQGGDSVGDAVGSGEVEGEETGEILAETANVDRGRDRDLTPTGTSAGPTTRRPSACRKLKSTSSNGPSASSTAIPISSSTPLPTRSTTVPTRIAIPPPLPLSTDDDDFSRFTSGPLNSPVPQLHAHAQRDGVSTPGGSGASTPLRIGIGRSASGYFGSSGVGGKGRLSRASSGLSVSAMSSSMEMSASSTISSGSDDLDSLESDTQVSVSLAPTPPTLSPEEESLRRLRWVSQISEYWSIDYLARMSGEEMDKVLDMWKDGQVGMVGGEAKGIVGRSSGPGGGPGGAGGMGAGGAMNGTPGGPALMNGDGANGHDGPSIGPPSTPRHDLTLTYPAQPPPLKQGKILLVGSGPGHPDLLTVAARKALESATLILSDKLVPAEVLALVPKSTELHIAKKFPGNAEGAQNEMMDLALEGAKRGETVVRLKQGDPFVYGRGGEEVLFFRENGFESVVIPGVSSALAGPLMMNVPVTQRGVAESMVLCTGVGRKGKAVQLPGYVRSRSLVVLMGVARIKQVLQVLLRPDSQPVEDIETQGWRDGAAFPPYLPIAIIERASSHDQRMVASTLENMEDALERSGEQRPPGMMIIGWAVLALDGKGDVTVLDDDENAVDAEERDRRRVETWLDGREYVLKDGLLPEWRSIAEATIDLA